MKTTLRTDWTVGDICKGFIYDKNEGKGLFGLSGSLIIQPEYQRNYIYGDGKKDVAVVEKQPPHSRDFSRELGGFFLQFLVTYGIISTWIIML